MIQKLKGTKDIIPGEIEKWQYVESQVTEVMKDFGVVNWNILCLDVHLRI